MKKTIRLTESDLSNIIQGTVTEIGRNFPAQENEFKQDRADLLRIWKHLKEFCKYSDSTEYDEGDKYREALAICIKILNMQ
jgi:hypothetical protein